MQFIVRALLSFTLVYAICSRTVEAAVPSKSVPTKFDFRAVTVASVVQLVYSEALAQAYVIDPEVLTDNRVVSFRFDGGAGDLRAFVEAFFDSLGLKVTRRQGIDFVSRKSVSVDTRGRADEVFVYRARHRDGAYLVELLGPTVSGSFSSRRGVRGKISEGNAGAETIAPPGSAAASVDHRTDTLVFSGAPDEVAKLRRLLPQVDFPLGDVLVRGVLYEVQTDKKGGSSFGVALNLLGGSVKIGTGPLAAAPGATYIGIKNNSIEAVLAVLSSDSRFKAVSKPTLRVTSGGAGRFTVGQDVPVLGAVSYPGAGQAPVQSVTYQSSGVIYDIQPVIRDGSIEIAVMQQTSTFVATNTGVAGSPTLIKRELKSNLTLADGEIVVMGGLTDSKHAQANSGSAFFPEFLRTKTDDTSGVEILLILQVTKV